MARVRFLLCFLFVHILAAQILIHISVEPPRIQAGNCKLRKPKKLALNVLALRFYTPSISIHPSYSINCSRLLDVSNSPWSIRNYRTGTDLLGHS
jgi:hypothetical protein